MKGQLSAAENLKEEGAVSLVVLRTQPPANETAQGGENLEEVPSDAERETHSSRRVSDQVSQAVGANLQWPQKVKKPREAIATIQTNSSGEIGAKTLKVSEKGTQDRIDSVVARISKMMEGTTKMKVTIW